MARKKYTVNIDFTTDSKIHLNSELFSIDKRCLPRKKIRKYGDWVSFTKEEVKKIVEKKKKLFFDERQVTNLTKCNLCSKLKEYDFGYLPEKIKPLATESIQVTITQKINYEKIIECLEDIRFDIKKIVQNLHLLKVNKVTQNSFTENLWVVDKSIDEGRKALMQKKYYQRLIDHGFYEQEFNRKNQLYQDSRQYEFPSEDNKPQTNEHWYDGIFRWVGRNLNIINVILGSLSSIIPALGAATEYKETLEHAINYA